MNKQACYPKHPDTSLKELPLDWRQQTTFRTWNVELEVNNFFRHVLHTVDGISIIKKWLGK